MLPTTKKFESHGAIVVYTILALVLMLGIFTGSAPSQNPSIVKVKNKLVAEKTVAANFPVYDNYKGIQIGTTADKVRETFGKAVIDDADGFYYEISLNETVDIRLDADKKVKYICVTYAAGNKSAPTYKDVFGTGAEMRAKPDGSIYNLVRFPKAGYWVAYSRTPGDNASVTVTIQKL